MRVYNGLCERSRFLRAARPRDVQHLFVSQRTVRGVHAPVGDGERVAHAALAHARYVRYRAVLRFHPLAGVDVGYELFQLIRRHEAEIETHAARKYRRGQLMHFRRAQHEYDVRGRLFQRFEQSVERSRRKHVHLVDDVYFIPAHRRHVVDVLAQLAYLVYTVVGSRVHLHDIEIGRRRERLTRFALAARAAMDGVQAVDRTREYLGAARLARASAAREKVGVRKRSPLYLMHERGNDDVLTYDPVERRRTVFAVKRGLHSFIPRYLTVKRRRSFAAWSKMAFPFTAFRKP